MIDKPQSVEVGISGWSAPIRRFPLATLFWTPSSLEQLYICGWRGKHGTQILSILENAPPPVTFRRASFSFSRSRSMLCCFIIDAIMFLYDAFFFFVWEEEAVAAGVVATAAAAAGDSAVGCADGASGSTSIGSGALSFGAEGVRGFFFCADADGAASTPPSCFFIISRQHLEQQSSVAPLP